MTSVNSIVAWEMFPATVMPAVPSAQGTISSNPPDASPVRPATAFGVLLKMYALNAPKATTCRIRFHAPLAIAHAPHAFPTHIATPAQMATSWRNNRMFHWAPVSNAPIIA